MLDILAAMNRGKIVLGACTVLSLLGAAAFVVVVASPARVTLDSGFAECGPPTFEGKYVYGMNVTNNSDHPLTIDSIVAMSSQGLRGVRYWALPPSGIGAHGFGDEVASTIPGWSARRAVADAPLPPHRSVGIVIAPQLAAGSTKGFATDFAVTMTRHSGLSWTQTSNAGYGYAPIGSGGSAGDCWR